MPKKPTTLPKEDEMVSEPNDPKRVRQMRMYKGPWETVSLKDSINRVIRAERFQGLG